MITKVSFTFVKESFGMFQQNPESLPGYNYRGSMNFWKPEMHFSKTEWLGFPVEKAIQGGFFSYGSRYIRRKGNRVLRYIDTNT